MVIASPRSAISGDPSSAPLSISSITLSISLRTVDLITSTCLAEHLSSEEWQVEQYKPCIEHAKPPRLFLPGNPKGGIEIVPFDPMPLLLRQIAAHGRVVPQPGAGNQLLDRLPVPLPVGIVQDQDASGRPDQPDGLPEAQLAGPAVDADEVDRPVRQVRGTKDVPVVAAAPGRRAQGPVVPLRAVPQRDVRDVEAG
eukprot:CAMPEP_0183321816 /NCGR_PEP_ID=MMETSP0160_2-20130417/69913_1 /TAXON_ID=2839 ORGANISM="Odontella Sinensis, Strain Grunow 1884" /NCGR_SAMPLE_ID=MMETSP0160_2 /ASSEMBLY_ACC=CAM_ASM_000250 /LENGTH=196 /DNA_ID=CAMNT_0025488839 /DNA_START=74 /DNA_END=661 /DNA_ORIENTATION=-